MIFTVNIPNVKKGDMALWLRCMHLNLDSVVDSNPTLVSKMFPLTGISLILVILVISKRWT
jgi:hypothetical protein